MALLCPACSTENLPDARFCSECGAPIPPPSTGLHLPNSTMLHNHTYCIEAVLGRGGFGITYRASDVRLQMPVAIKEFCPPGCLREGTHIVPTAAWPAAMHAEGLRRFMQEGRTLARFHHPNIVRVLFMFEENGTGYLVMEMVAGETLEAVLKRTGILMPRKGLEVARRVGEALIEVHKGGLLHLDIKPSNIIHTADDRYVLVDFGTARQFVAMSAKPQSVFLTPGYSPPEQYSERAPRTRASDVYSLAATIYHLLTGEMPPTAADRALGGGELQPLRALNPLADVRLEQAIMRGMALDTRDRTATMEEFLAELGVASTLGALAVEAAVHSPSGPLASGGRSEWPSGPRGATGGGAAASRGEAGSPEAPAAGTAPPSVGATGGGAPVASSTEGTGGGPSPDDPSSGAPGPQARHRGLLGMDPALWRLFAPFLFVALVLLLLFIVLQVLTPSAPRVEPLPGPLLGATPTSLPAAPVAPAPSTAATSPSPSPSGASPSPVGGPPVPGDASPSASPGAPTSPEAPGAGATPSPAASSSPGPVGWVPQVLARSSLPIACVAWSDDGALLAAGDQAGTLWVWKLREGGAEPGEIMRGVHSGPIRSLSFSADGRSLASLDTSAQNPIWVWDVPSGKIRRRLGGRASGPRLAFAKVGDVLAFADDSTLCLRNADSGSPVARLGPADGLTTQFSSDGLRIAAASASTVRIWPGDGKGAVIRQVYLPGGASAACLGMSGNGQALAVGTADGTLCYWAAGAEADPTFTVARAFNGGAVFVGLTPGGAVLCADASGVAVRETARGDVASQLTVSQGVSDVALAPSGERLAVGCRDGCVRLYDVSSWKLGRVR